MSAAYEIAVIGTSWGGLDAIGELLAGLPVGIGLSLVLVQHRHRDSSSALASVLQDRTRLRIIDIEDKQPASPGSVYIAPPDYHLLVEPGFFSLSTDAPVRYSRPSIDLAFISAADAYGERTVGVVLTGSNNDGAQGLRRIAERGGMTLVQDPVTAESPQMPAAALAAVPAARSMSIPEISRFMSALPTPRRTASADAAEARRPSP